MFFPEGQVRVFLYRQPVNMRLSLRSSDVLMAQQVGAPLLTMRV